MLKIKYLDPPKKWLIYEISPYLGTFFQFEQGYLEVCFFDMLISARFALEFTFWTMGWSGQSLQAAFPPSSGWTSTCGQR